MTYDLKIAKEGLADRNLKPVLEDVLGRTKLVLRSDLKAF